MNQVKVYSRSYQNVVVKFGTELVKFANGEAEISEDLYKKIKEMNFPIYTKEDQPQYKTANQIDADATIDEMKKEYLAEIDRLNNIVNAKNKEIERLNLEVKTWKEEFEKLSKQKDIKEEKKTSQNEEKSVEKELSSELKEVKEDLQKMSIKELKELIEEEKIQGAEGLTKKEDLINCIISSYNK